MQLKQLYFIVELSKYGTISNMAEQLSVPQSTVSTAIKSLESELGCRLVDRGRSGSVFTPEGERVYETAKIVLEEMEHINQVAKRPKLPNMTLRIGCMPCIIQLLPVPAAAAITDRYPDLRIAMEILGEQELVAGISADERDFGIINYNNLSARDIAAIKKSGMVCENLLDDKIVLTTRADHPLAHRADVTIKDVMKYDVLRLKDSLSKQTAQLLADNDYSGNIVSVSDEYTLRERLIQTDALALTSRYALYAEQLAKKDNNIEINPVDFNVESKLCVIYKEDRVDEIGEEFLRNLRTEADRLRSVFEG